MYRLFFAVLIIACAVSSVGRAKELEEYYKNTPVVLYQPESLMKYRTNPEELASYIKHLENVLFTEINKTGIDENFDLVVAVRETDEVKFWFICHDQCALKSRIDPIIEKLQSIRTAKASGMVTFALKYRQDSSEDSDEAPYPAEWKKAFVNKDAKAMTVDELLEKIWK